MLGKFVIAYIDEILIYSPSLDIHVTHIRQVLSYLLKNQLYIKGEKCEFHVPEILFQGYIISQEDVATAKVAAVTEWPIPKTIKDLQYNFCRRFIWGFSSITTPSQPSSRGAPNAWLGTPNEAFTKLKTSFTTAPIHKYSDPSKPLLVEVDASESGVGAVLSQCFG